MGPSIFSEQQHRTTGSSRQAHRIVIIAEPVCIDDKNTDAALPRGGSKVNPRLPPPRQAQERRTGARREHFSKGAAGFTATCAFINSRDRAARQSALCG